MPDKAPPKAELRIDDKVLDVPVVVGTEDEHAIDIGKLRAKTGYVTLDPAFMNTASTKSAITFLDGEKGILRYRGIPIEELAEKSTFVEIALPAHLRQAAEQGRARERSRTLLTRHSLIHEDMKHFFDGYPSTAHPMAILSAMVLLAVELTTREALDVNNKDEHRHHHRAPALEGADDRGVLVQEVDRPAVRLPEELALATARTSST